MKKITLLIFLLVSALGFSQTQVTFKVDMTNYTGLTATDVVYVSGTFNNWSANANPLTREGTTNIWSAVLPITPGNIEYKFQINSWFAQENLTSGTSCTLTTNGFTNRFLAVGTTAITIPTVCWQSCNACNVTPPNTNVTFKVDMSNYTGLTATDVVYVAGTFNAWSGTSNPLTREGTTNVWSVVLPIPQSTIEYKFQINNWAADERLTAGSSCTVTANGFTNRSLVVGSTAIVNPVVCWASCASCTAPSLPIDFESSTVTYTFADFDGGVATKIANPNSGGINTSANVARLVKNAGQPWGGTSMVLAAPINFSVNKIFKVKVYSPRVGAKVLLKVENARDGNINFEKEVLTTVANAWEEMTFDYSLISTTNSYDKLVIIFERGTIGDGSANFTFLFDEIRLIAPTVVIVAPTLPIDFESTTVTYGFTDFDGGVGTKIANPNPGGINTSANVGRIVKGAGRPWAGSLLTFAAPIDFTVNKIFKVKVYSPRVGAKLNLKVEGAVGVVPYEREVVGTVANAWEEMTFDYQAVSTTNQYTKLVFMFDKETEGDASANFTFLVDDIRLIPYVGPVLTQMNLPVTFDDSTVNYNLNSFGGTTSTIETDPTLSTNKVAKVIKNNASQIWAGTTLGVGAGTTETGFSSAIPFTTTERRMNVRVWSPTAGTPVRLKVEVAGQAALSVETDALTTVANGWQVMEFNFNNQATSTAAFNPASAYNKASIFFNFGTAGSGQTYYFDDMRFGAAALGVNSFNASNIRMYPNPTSSVFTIEANDVIENVTLYNVLGQQVLAKTANGNSVTLDVANLQTGVYVVKTVIGGVVSTSRLVKN
jgi:hypothetical protein